MGRGVNEPGERSFGAGLADTSMAVVKEDRCWGFNCTVLEFIVSIRYLPRYLYTVETQKNKKHSLDKQPSRNVCNLPPYLSHNPQPFQSLHDPLPLLGNTSPQPAPYI